MNWTQARLLIAAQVKQDLRHPKTGTVRASRMAMTAVSYGFSGLVLALSLGAAVPATLCFVATSFGMVLAAFGIVGSYDELMGRPRENAWMLTLPAAQATQYMARLGGIGVFLLLIAGSMVVPVAGHAMWTHGVVVGLEIAALIACGTIWTALAMLGVLWTLTLVLPYRVLKPVLTAVRVALIGALVLGYQWIGNLDMATRAGVTPVATPWWPAQWFADALSGTMTPGLAVLLATVGLGAIAFGLVFPRRYFALLRAMHDGEQRMRERTVTQQSGKIAQLVERLTLRTPESRAAYGFAQAAFANDRIVRGRVWTAALLPLGFALFGWWQGGLGDLFVYSAEGRFLDQAVQMHLSVLIVLLFCCQTLVQSLQFSDDADAAWLFDALPVGSARALQMGAQQALAYQVLLPLHGVLALVLALGMPVGHALLHAGYWYAVALLMTRLQVFFYRTAPFSRRADRFSAAERFVPLFLSIPGAIVFVLLQAFAFRDVVLAAQVITVMLLASAWLVAFAGWLAERKRAAAPVLATPEPAVVPKRA
ncbi:MAG: hypothetical protein AAFX41_07120 [Bacteroidota bacterium]